MWNVKASSHVKASSPPIKTTECGTRPPRSHQDPLPSQPNLPPPRKIRQGGILVVGCWDLVPDYLPTWRQMAGSPPTLALFCIFHRVCLTERTYLKTHTVSFLWHYDMIYILGPCLQKGALSTGDCKGRESHDGRECVIGMCVCEPADRSNWVMFWLSNGMV